MRILFAFQYHPPVQLGGAEVSGDLLASEASRHHNVLRLAPSWGVLDNSRDDLSVFEFVGEPYSWLDQLRMTWVAIRATRRAVREFQPDLVVANSMPAAIWAVPAVRSLKNRPRVAVIARDYSWWCPTNICRITRGAPRADCGVRRFARTCSFESMEIYREDELSRSRYWVGLMFRWWSSRLSAFAGRRADQVYSNSRHLAETWTEREGSAARHLGGCVELPDQHASSTTRTPSPPILVRQMSDMSPAKGSQVLKAAIEQLSDPENWRFEVYGKAGDVSPGRSIERFDRLDHDSALAVMAEADLVVVPSVYPEALNRTAIEAQLGGTPVVAVRNSGVPEAVAPTGGVLVPADDPGGLANGLLEARRRLEAGEFDLDSAAEWIEREHSTSAAVRRLLNGGD